MAAKKVLIFAPYGAWMVHHQLDAVVGAALAHRGCEVTVAICDGFLESCFIAGKPPKPENCRACSAQGARVFTGLGLRTVQLRSLITPEDQEAAAAFSAAADPARMGEVRFEKYPLGKWCPPSMQSYFSTADFRLDLDWVVKAIRDQFLNGALLTRALNRLMDRIRPDHVFAYNSTHFYYRIASELAKERGLPVLVHERGHLNDSFTLLDGESTNSNQGRFDAYRAWRDVPLAAEECREVQTYFREREEGKNGFSRFYAYESGAEGVRGALRIPEGVPILALFGSGDRELGAFETVQRKTFVGQIEWIRRTAEICRKRGWYLVIRHHPSNVMKDQVNFPFITALMELNRELPDCVRVVMPHERLTSYAILWNADGAVTHFSTMGSETPTRGVVGVCVGDSLYQPLGVEWAGAPEDYEAALASSVEKTRAFGLDELRRAYRGAHYVVFKLGYKFRSFGIKDVYAPDIRVRSLSELEAGNDPILDRLCDHVMAGGPLLPVPGSADLARSAAEEDAFLRGELEEIRSRRASVKAAAGGDRIKPASEGPVLTVVSLGADASGIREKALARSRERSLERLEAAARPGVPAFASLAEAVGRARGRYVYVALPGVDPGEALLANSADFLDAEGNGDFNAVAWGAWIAGPSGSLTGEIFTEARHPATFEDALALSADQADPLRQFAAVVMRREFLADLLGWLDAMSGFDSREVAASLFTLLRGGKAGESVKAMAIPMAACYPVPAAAPSSASAAAAATSVTPVTRMEQMTQASSPSPAPGPAIRVPNHAILDVGPDELRSRLEAAASAFARSGGDPESGLACADLLLRLGEGEGARRVLNALLQRAPGDARLKAALDGAEWRSRQGLAAVNEWSLRGRAYEALHAKRTVDTWAEARPFVESVPGWMLPGQEQFLFEKVKSLPDGAVILEMGADRGRSTSAMALACKGTGKRIYSIDTFAGNDGIMGKTYDFLHEWRGNLARLGVEGYVTPVQGYTFDMLPKWDRSVDFAFIDASHEYIDVLADYALTYPHVKEGGWIAFHDVEPGWPGPWRVWLDFGIPMLTDHQVVATLACGRKSRTLPVRRPFQDGIAFSFPAHWAKELDGSPDPAARAFAAAMRASMEFPRADQAGQARAREAERGIRGAPDYLKATIRHMITKDAFLDGWLHYWQGLVLEAEGRGDEAFREFRLATRVSYPAAAGLVEPHLRGAPAEPAPAAVPGEAWLRRRLEGAETLLGWRSGDGLLLQALPGLCKVGIEPDVKLQRKASLEAGIDAVERAGDLPDACADVAISAGGLEREPSPLASLQALAPKLKTGGRALFLVPTRPETSGDPALYSWTPATLRNLFIAAGFAVREAAYAAADGSACAEAAAEFVAVAAERAPAAPVGVSGEDWAMVPARQPAPAASAGTRGLDPRDLPVALVAYARPEHTRRVLEALSQRGIRNLHVFLDGARGNGDEQAVKETRKLVESVSWVRPEIHAAGRNRGLAKSIMAATDTLLSVHDHLILLEDDCVPQRHCFDFMAKALDRYRDDPKVFGISGYTVPMTRDILDRYPYDAYFCPRIGSWGWATWKRAWSLLETDLLAACRKVLDRGVDLDQGGNDIPPMLEGMLQGHVKDVWTMNWVLTVYLHGGQYLYPTVSHIDNIGMDGSGVHCGKTDKYITTLAETPATRFPDRVVPDPAVLARFRAFYDRLPAGRANP